MKSKLSLPLVLICSLFTTISFAKNEFKGFEIDKKDQDKKHGITLKSGKKGDVRMYQASITQTFNGNLENIKNSVINFEDKCNNEKSDERRYLKKKKKCQYLNQNLVESKIKRKIKKYQSEKNEIDRFVIFRHASNRGTHTHNDLLKIYQYKNAKAQDEIKVSMRMLSEKEAKKVIKDPIETSTAFLHTFGEFIITVVGPNKVQVSYTYTSKTDHWLINKSISAGKVFDSMSSGFKLLFKSIKQENKKLVKKKEILANSAG